MLFNDLVRYHPLFTARPITATAKRMTELAKKRGEQERLNAHDGAFAYYLAAELSGRAPHVVLTQHEINLWRAATVPVIRGVVLYLWFVCLREMRHGRREGCLKAFGKSAFDEFTPAESVVREICETGDFIDAVSETDASAVDVAEALDRHFKSGRWSGAFGGKAWGTISEVLLGHLRGDMSAAMATDRAWTLQHNTSSVFNKNVIWRLQKKRLLSVLDAQAKSTVLDAEKHVSGSSPVTAARKLHQQLQKRGAIHSSEDEGSNEGPSQASAEGAYAPGLHILSGVS